MEPLLIACVVLSTLAFGAVYPWGYGPLFAIAFALGAVGIVRSRAAVAESRAVAMSLAGVAIAIGLQLIPLSPFWLERLSHNVAPVASVYSLAFVSGASNHPLSIDPRHTLVAWLAVLSLGVYMAGLPGLLSSSVLRRFPAHVMVFGVALGLFALMQHQRANGLVYWFWQPEEGSGMNAFGPFVNRNHFAGWMVMSTSLAFGYWLGRLERLRGGRVPSWRDRTMWLASPEASRTLCAAGGLVVMAVALVWPLSRSGIVSFSAALVCFAYLAGTRVQLGVGRRALAAASIALLPLLVAFWRGPDRILQWFADTADAESRVAAWQDAWRVFKDFPLTGTGLNTYGTSMIFYQKSNPNFHLGSAHNDYLQLLVEGGLLVTVPALFAIGALALAIRRNVRAARRESRGYWIRAGAAVGLIAMAVQETVEFSLQIPANAFLFCTLAAIALAPIGRPPLETS